MTITWEKLISALREGTCLIWWEKGVTQVPNRVCGTRSMD